MLYDIVARVPGYRFRGSGLNSRLYQIFYEWGSLSLVSTIEGLLGRKSSGSGLKKTRIWPYRIRRAHHATPSIRKSGH
jgi:hypothetical protein